MMTDYDTKEFLTLSEMMSTKNRLLLLISELTRKHGSIDSQDLIEEALEVFENEYKTDKVARQRMHQIISELKEEKKIVTEHKKNKTLVAINCIVPKTFNIERIVYKRVFMAVLAFVWFLFAVSWFTYNIWVVFLLFVNAMLVSVAYVVQEKRFVLRLKETTA